MLRSFPTAGTYFPVRTFRRVPLQVESRLVVVRQVKSGVLVVCYRHGEFWHPLYCGDGGEQGTVC